MPDERPTTQSHLGGLGFTPRPMVRWLEPRELVRAALDVVLSGLFGTYADKRELLAVHPAERWSYADRDEMWLDYVADLGDGFDSTYAIATQLAAAGLAGEHGGERWETERGRVLVMGGDEVYPAADRTEYEDRLLGPYGAALPRTPEGAAPHLFAIPGNHDWYDGLTNFMRIFGQGEWVGGWLTRQRRSYFALQLPHRWRLWGIDIQFDAYIDGPQLDYFKAAAEGMGEGDRVILATGKPSWVKVRDGEPVPDSYRNLAYFERKLIRDRGARVALTLSGDLHHYCRYESLDGSDHKITCGGGGAYLYPTHHMPGTLNLPEEPGVRAGGTARGHRLAARYPDAGASRRLRWGALRLPLDVPGLGWAIAALYALLALTFAIGIRDEDGSVVGVARERGFGDLLPDAIGSGSMAVAAVLVAALVAFAAAPGRIGPVPAGRPAVGGAHALVHLAAALALTAGAVELLAAAAPDIPAFWALWLPVAAVAFAGRWFGALLFAAYLVVADVAFGRRESHNANNAFAGQAIPGYKSFLRLRIGPEGSLTVFPFGVEKVPRRWSPNPGGGPGDPRLIPAGGPVRPTLIEPPIPID